MVRQGAGSRRARGFVCPGRDGPVGLRVALFAEGIRGDELRVEIAHMTLMNQILI